MTTRRDFVKMGNMLGLTWLLAPTTLLASETPSEKTLAGKPIEDMPWEDGSRMIISISMQFESGGQNSQHSLHQNAQKKHKDISAETLDQYGYKEGIPRLLELWDRYNIKVTSHIVPSAAIKTPDHAKDIALRGHEIAVQGANLFSHNDLSYEEEKKIILEEINTIKNISGKTPVGYNTNWLRGEDHTLRILQELGFTYYINDISRDEPFVIRVNDNSFAVVPHTLRCNDSILIENRNFSPDQFLSNLQMEFDQLYDEASYKRRMMSICLHDRISGTPQMVQAMKEFLNYAYKHKGVSFKRKDEIAKMILNSKIAIKE